jgi:hypothetical protein
VIDGVRARRRSAQAATGSPAAPDVLAAGAATQGATALKLDTAVAEPLRATETAPRLRVAPPAPISAPRAPFIAGVIALVVAGVLGILLINTKTNENSFEISRLREQKTALDTRQQQLENQLAVYDSTGNLSAAAKRLGLVKADTPAYIRLPDGKVIGVPRPGAGQPAVTAQDAADAAGTSPNKAGTTPVQPNTPAGSTQGQPVQGQQGQPVQGQGQQGLPAGAAPAQPGIQGGLVTGQPVVPVQPVVPGAGE